MEISGFVSYNYFSTQFNTDEKSKQQTGRIEPVFSYFIADNVSLGIELSYLFQKTEFELSGESIIIEQTFTGPVAKIYFGKEKFRPFITADYLFMVGDRYEGSALDLGAGIFYHMAGNFGFSLTGKYGIIWSGKNDIDSQNRIFIGIGISSFIL